ncbi:hypothetical protein HYZ78_03335 [Candidatus Microgenomates bacterium]|nr:hypothetical protein [Candidatus Microgenomates bacterium]
MFQKFWKWYNKHLTENTSFTAGLFVLQLAHLYWLTTHVVVHKAFGVSLWDPSPLLQWLIIVVDYTEIPALVATSILYINELRKKQGSHVKEWLYLFFLNIQFVHIFWITDEFVLESFTGTAGTFLPAWLAWIAIIIDYLELPVIFETLRKAFVLVKKRLV